MKRFLLLLLCCAAASAHAQDVIIKTTFWISSSDLNVNSTLELVYVPIEDDRINYTIVTNK